MAGQESADVHVDRAAGRHPDLRGAPADVDHALGIGGVESYGRPLPAGVVADGQPDHGAVVVAEPHQGRGGRQLHHRVLDHQRRRLHQRGGRVDPPAALGGAHGQRAGELAARFRPGRGGHQSHPARLAGSDGDLGGVEVEGDGQLGVGARQPYGRRSVGGRVVHHHGETGGVDVLGPRDARLDPYGHRGVDDWYGHRDRDDLVCRGPGQRPYAQAHAALARRHQRGRGDPEPDHEPVLGVGQQAELVGGDHEPRRRPADIHGVAVDDVRQVADRQGQLDRRAVQRDDHRGPSAARPAAPARSPAAGASGGLRRRAAGSARAGSTFGITRVSISSSAGGCRGVGTGVLVAPSCGQGAGLLPGQEAWQRRQNWVPCGFCSPQASQAAVVIVVGPPLAYLHRTLLHEIADVTTCRCAGGRRGGITPSEAGASAGDTPSVDRTDLPVRSALR